MSRKPELRDDRDVVAWAIWDEMRGRAGIKHFFLHVDGKPTEGTFADHRKWLREVAATVLRNLAEPQQ